MGLGHVPDLCPRFHRASELIGRRWTGAIIYVLLKARCRFAELRAAIPDITDRMLSDRLQELEQEGVVARTVVPETPVRVEYELTRKGRALAAAIDAIAAWAEKWVTVPASESEDAPAAMPRRGQAIRAEASRATGQPKLRSARRERTVRPRSGA